MQLMVNHKLKNVSLIQKHATARKASRCCFGSSLSTSRPKGTPDITAASHYCHVLIYIHYRLSQETGNSRLLAKLQIIKAQFLNLTIVPSRFVDNILDIF
jgi:hypothetical protein